MTVGLMRKWRKITEPSFFLALLKMKCSKQLGEVVVLREVFISVFTATKFLIFLSFSWNQAAYLFLIWFPRNWRMRKDWMWVFVLHCFCSDSLMLFLFFRNYLLCFLLRNWRKKMITMKFGHSFLAIYFKIFIYLFYMG